MCMIVLSFAYKLEERFQWAYELKKHTYGMLVIDFHKSAWVKRHLKKYWVMYLGNDIFVMGDEKSRNAEFWAEHSDFHLVEMLDQSLM